MQRGNIKWREKNTTEIEIKRKNLLATMGWKGEATTGVGVFSEVWEEILRPVNWEFRNPNSETTKLQRVLLINTDSAQHKKANWNWEDFSYSRVEMDEGLWELVGETVRIEAKTKVFPSEIAEPAIALLFRFHYEFFLIQLNLIKRVLSMRLSTQCPSNKFKFIKDILSI